MCSLHRLVRLHCSRFLITHNLGRYCRGQAAELLDLPWIDLRTRFMRLDIPLRTGPADLDEAQAEVANLAAWLEHGRP